MGELRGDLRPRGGGADGPALAAAEVLALIGGVVNAWLFLTR
jgi:hypothetical protein